MSSEGVIYDTRQLQTTNMGDLAALHYAVYQRRLPVSFFAKKYHTGYTGVQHVGYLAYNPSGKPIAFYGVIPCFLKIGGQSILSAQSADTMTHPRYRNIGLFVKLATLTFDLCRAKGIRLLFGFPNQNSLPGFVNKLGWQATDRMDCFTIPANGFNWEGYLKKLPVLKVVYRFYSNRLLKKYTVNRSGLEGALHQEGFDGVERTAGYLAYKTYHATKVIQLQHTLIWLKINNGLIIGDMQLADDFDDIMHRILTIARKIGVKQVMFQASPGIRLHQLFKARYLAIPSFPVIFKNLDNAAPLNNFKFTTADMDTF